MELFWSIFSHIRAGYGEILSISPYSVPMWENTNQNNFKYGHFLRSVYLKCIWFCKYEILKFLAFFAKIKYTRNCKSLSVLLPLLILWWFPQCYISSFSKSSPFVFHVSQCFSQCFYSFSGCFSCFSSVFCLFSILDFANHYDIINIRQNSKLT